MLRLTLLLCLGMLAALYTLGEDRGQLRPGLVKAKAEGRLEQVWAEARAKAARTLPAAAETVPVPVVAETAPAAAPLPELPPEPEPMLANASPAITPVVDVEPGREVIAAVAEPVFTLSALGNEPVPGADGRPVATEAPVPETIAEGAIRYVTASSVNVRSGPSTAADILGRLGNGEAALLVAAVDDEWGRIVVQGDGMEGYVALRFLSAEAP
ncbi:SH3 domain-containing protein [Tabrizicola sp. YIM 78059]|uniref:SH3 domain-containing protein n=1 Tax=Tabrizicola sp. YIM 78059 TaxID=2529861 RepID=UPI0010AAA5EF|nr:SH3 domain-containing protein [Tabrizicola sp. YIM 78059]